MTSSFFGNNKIEFLNVTEEDILQHVHYPNDASAYDYKEKRKFCTNTERWSCIAVIGRITTGGCYNKVYSEWFT